MSATGSRSEDGATLIEMLVVLGILALITGLVFPAWTGPLQRIALFHARDGLIANLRTARAESIRHGEPVALELADDGRGYGWGLSRVTLPRMVGIAGEPRSIGFFADGSSSGGVLKITGRDGVLAVAVDPATGVAAASSAR
jgi:general secretion pathway protein H